jgi:hypothetical protein
VISLRGDLRAAAILAAAVAVLLKVHGSALQSTAINCLSIAASFQRVRGFHWIPQTARLHEKRSQADDVWKSIPSEETKATAGPNQIDPHEKTLMIS